MAAAVIAFGSNLDNPAAQVRAAIAAVSALPLIGSLKTDFRIPFYNKPK